MGKPSPEGTVWFWMQNLALLSEAEIDEIETQGVKFYQLSPQTNSLRNKFCYQ